MIDLQRYRDAYSHLTRRATRTDKLIEDISALFVELIKEVEVAQKNTDTWSSHGMRS